MPIMERHILCDVLRLAVVCQLVYVTSCDVDAGMRVTVTEKTLQEINRIEIAEMETKIRQEQIPDAAGEDGSVEWELEDIHVTNLDSLTADLDLQSGNKITWSGSMNTITVKADYEAEKTFVFILPVWSHGVLTAKLHSTSTDITVRLSVVYGKLVIKLDRCTAHIGDLDLESRGSLLSWLVNIIVDVFEGDIKDKLEDAFCDVVQEKLSDLSTDMMDIKTLYDVELVGLQIGLDTSFAAISVNHDSIAFYNKGEFIWNGRRYSPADSGDDFLPKSDLGLGFDLKTDAVNNLMVALAAGGKLDGELAFQELKKRNLTFLNLNCEKICIGKAFRKASKNFPDSVLGMHWSVSYGGLEVQKDELLGRLVGRVFFRAENGNQSVHLFSAAMNLTVHFQVRFAVDTLSVRAVGLGGLILIDESHIGKVLSSNVQFFLERIVLRVMREELLKIINDDETDFPIQLPDRTSFKDAVIRLYPGVMRVEADICYKSVCDFSGTGDWVGNYTTDNFHVRDIIPTTTTRSTSTTTTATTPTTTTELIVTTNKQSETNRHASGVDTLNPIPTVVVYLYTLFLCASLL